MFSNMALKHSDLLMPNSQGLAEDTVLDKYREKVVVIHHGVDLDQYSLDSKKSGGRGRKESERELMVLNVGGLIKVKGWKYVVETAEKLKKYHIKFIIIGRNSDLKEYNKRISELKLDNIEFFDSPSHEILKKYYRNADIFFLPSLSEGLPNSMLEASAMENALIGSGKGGTRDIIVEGENGYYIREPSAEAFAEKILFLYKHPKELAKMKRRSRKLVGKQFSWEDNTKRMVAAFQKLIDKSN
jgi:glycosyltransferase involved in cell wall biosynthesis